MSVVPAPDRPSLSVNTSASPTTRDPLPNKSRPTPIPQVVVNGKDHGSLPSPSRSNTINGEDGWGSNFWVTLVDPQVRGLQRVVSHSHIKQILLKTTTAFYACPATGQVSWDPPVGNFVQVTFSFSICRVTDFPSGCPPAKKANGGS